MERLLSWSNLLWSARGRLLQSKGGHSTAKEGEAQLRTQGTAPVITLAAFYQTPSTFYPTNQGWSSLKSYRFWVAQRPESRSNRASGFRKSTQPFAFVSLCQTRALFLQLNLMVLIAKLSFWQFHLEDEVVIPFRASPRADASHSAPHARSAPVSNTARSPLELGRQLLPSRRETSWPHSLPGLSLAFGAMN